MSARKVRKTASARFLNRELSWLEFNHRVLEEAREPSTPLLERLKFLAITASNLDEFFMVRVGGLQCLARSGVRAPDPAGLTPGDQLRAISERAHRMASEQSACFLEELEPELAAAEIRRLRPEALSERQAKVADLLFARETSAIVTPMTVSSPEDFPLLAGNDLNMLVRLAGDSGAEDSAAGDSGAEDSAAGGSGAEDSAAGDSDAAESRFAVIPLGRVPSRFVTLPSEGGYAYMLVEDLVGMFADRLFPGEDVMECIAFRISRDADLAVQEEWASDLKKAMEHVLEARTESHCVRLEIASPVSSESRDFLASTLDVREPEIFEFECPLDLAAYMRIATLDGWHALKYEPWTPRVPVTVDPTKSLFEIIGERDVLLVHPYDSFEPVLRLIEEAAEDPDVLAIKQVLYRTSRDSPVVAALKRAAERGKYVTALVELKARFDEARNIEWARELEKSGAQVVYGVKNYKVHAKLCVIVRREPQGIRRYVHYGTGNYNEVTARLYTDVSVMTVDDDLGADATTFFHAVAGNSRRHDFHEFAIAPTGLRDRLLQLIEAEALNARNGQRGLIVAKVNSLLDPTLIEALYAASQAGVEVRLIVRGICALVPGVAGLSENIEVVSIVGRYLEHSRVFRFHHGGDEIVLISSADWMPRNLDKRLELLVPVKDRGARQRLIEMLDLQLADQVQGRHLQSDGSWARFPGEEGEGSQAKLHRMAAESEGPKLAVFEPHRSPAEG